MSQILVVDDEIGIRELLSEILRDEGYDVLLAENAAAARAARQAGRPDLVLLDIWMPDSDGITLLKEWAGGGKLTMPVIMMSGHGTIDTAVEATKIGAMDFLEKPIALQKLLAAVKRALAKTPPVASGGLSLAAFGRSLPLRDLKKRVEQMAAKSRVLMIKTAPGGIVELVARSLHAPGKAWIDISLDSMSLSVDVLEEAAGGVLYVEEIGRLTRLQQKNLMFAVERLEKFAVRLAAATSQDHASLLAAGWEEQQLTRLFDVWLSAPTLVELADEIPEIANHLLAHLADSDDVPPRRLSTGALNSLRQHSWPGGYGELKSVVKSLALTSLEEEIAAEDVAQLLTPQAEKEAPCLGGLTEEVMALPLREAREIFERIYFEHHLRQEHGNITRLSERSGLERTHLYRKLRDLGLRTPRKEEES